MYKTWLVAVHHLRQEVLKRSFVLTLLSLPLFLAAVAGSGLLSSKLEQNQSVLGYADPSGRLVPAELSDEETGLVAFATDQQARAALDAGEIDAYFRLSPDYPQDLRADLVYYEEPGGAAVRLFQTMVRRDLLHDRPVTIVDRALYGSTVTVRATATHRVFPGGDPDAGMVVPLVAGAMLAFLLFTTAGYMMNVMVGEKENHTMEVVITSVSSRQLLAGKVIGGIVIALVQLLVWIGCLVGVVWLGGNVLGVEWLRNVVINWRDLLSVLVAGAGSYLFGAAFMSLLGTTLVERQESQQAGAFIFLPTFIPLYLLVPISQDPSGPLAVALTLLPITSTMATAMRSLFLQVPLWQVVVSVLIGTAGGLLLVWLAAKAFRAGMLQYGNRMQWREVLKPLSIG